jgi:hypothetical protein
VLSRAHGGCLKSNAASVAVRANFTRPRFGERHVGHLKGRAADAQARLQLQPRNVSATRLGPWTSVLSRRRETKLWYIGVATPQRASDSGCRAEPSARVSPYASAERHRSRQERARERPRVEFRPRSPPRDHGRRRSMSMNRCDCERSMFLELHLHSVPQPHSCGSPQESRHAVSATPK